MMWFSEFDENLHAKYLTSCSVGFQNRDINNIRKAVESTKGQNCALFVNRSETQRLFFFGMKFTFDTFMKNGGYWMLQKMTMEKFEKL